MRQEIAGGKPEIRSGYQGLCGFRWGIELSRGGIEEEVNRLMVEIEGMDPGELERDVYQEMAFLLCKGCRDRFVEDPLSRGEGPYPAGEGPSRFVH